MLAPTRTCNYNCYSQWFHQYALRSKFPCSQFNASSVDNYNSRMTPWQFNEGKPINHQPSRLCWNQYTLPTKPAFLPKYWLRWSLSGNDMISWYNMRVRWWLSQTFFLTGPHHINSRPEEKHSRMLRFKEISLFAKCSIGMKRLFSPVSTVKTAWKRCCISRTINRRPTDQQSTRQSYSEEDRLHDWVGLLKVL